jgi:hypothetical protein
LLDLLRGRSPSEADRGWSHREAVLRAQRAAVLLGECVSDCGPDREPQADEDLAERRSTRLLRGKRELELSLREETLFDQQLAELASVGRIRRHTL